MKKTKELKVSYSLDRISKKIFWELRNLREANLLSEYPNKVYVTQVSNLTNEQLQALEQTDADSSYTRLKEDAGVVEIFIFVENEDMIKKVYNNDNFIFFRREKINIGDNTKRFSELITLDALRHETAHGLFTDLRKKTFEQIYEIIGDMPFGLVNVAEDARINTLMQRYPKNRVFYNELLKINPKDLEANANAISIFVSLCLTRNDKKYIYKSKEFKKSLEVYEKVIKSTSILQVAQVVSDFYKDYLKNNKNMQNSQTNKQNSSQDKKQQQKNSLDNGDDNEMFNFLNDSYDNPKEEIGEFKESKNQTFSDEINDFSDRKNQKSDIGQSDEYLQDTLDLITKNENTIIVNENFIKYSPPKEDKSNSDLVQIVKGVVGRNQKKCDDKIIPSTTAVRTNDYSFNNKIITKATKEAQKILNRNLPLELNAESSTISEHLNIENLYSIPLNPTLENVFSEKIYPKKVPKKIAFFLDCSGSMYGMPIHISKHLLMVLANLQKSNYIDATLILHQGSTNGDLVDIVELKDLISNKYAARISGIKVRSDEGIINAIEQSVKRVNFSKYDGVSFLTDANLCDEPQKIKEAIKKINNKNIFGFYVGYSQNSQNLPMYFKNWFKTSHDKNKNSEDILVATSIAIAHLLNPDNPIEKNIQNLVVSPYGKKNIISSYSKQSKKHNGINEPMEEYARPKM